MATIKGIEVQINGNATGLSKALEDVNKTLSSTQSNLTAVNKQLKFDPTNTELMAQKQQLLTEQIANTNEKLKALKDVESQVKAQFESGELGRDKYIAFQTELSKTEKSLESLKKASVELANQGFTQLGNTLESVGKKAENVGNKLAPLSATVGASGVAVLKMSTDFDNSLAKLETIADTSVVPMEELKKQIIELSNESGIAVSEVTQNVYDAISAGQNTADAVNFVRNATMLATGGFTESAKSLDILTTILNAYELEASEVTKVSDILIQTQNIGKTTVDELSSSMGKIIPTAKNANVSLEQVATGYAIMTARGIGTAETTTYMNEMFNELNKSSSKVSKTLVEKTGKSFSDLMKEGYSVADCLQIINESAKEQNLKFNDLWGSQTASKSALTLLGDSAELFNGTLVQMNNSLGSTATAYEIMQTPSEKLDKSINALKNAFLDFGAQLTPLIDTITQIVTTITEKITALDETQQQFILVVGAVLTALAPVLIIGGKLITGIGTAIKAISAFSTTLAVPIAPLALIVTAIGAVVGAIVYLWNTNEDFKKNMITIWNMLSATLMAILTPLIDTVKIIISSALDFITGLVQVFSAILTGDWQGLWDGVVTIFNSVWKIITEALPTLLDGLIGIIGDFFQPFVDVGESLFNSIWDGMRNIWNDLVDWVTDCISWIKNKLDVFNSSKKKFNKSSDSDDDADGSHADGLSYVPFDNYRAILHRGERVLTAEENKAYTAQGKSGTTVNVTQYISAPNSSARDVQRSARRELVKLGLGV